MLREHYPSDKLFEEILGYVPNFSPELEKIDSYLEDEKLYRLIRRICHNAGRRQLKREGTQRPWM